MNTKLHPRLVGMIKESDTGFLCPMCELEMALSGPDKPERKDTDPTCLDCVTPVKECPYYVSLYGQDCFDEVHFDFEMNDCRYLFVLRFKESTFTVNDSGQGYAEIFKLSTIPNINFFDIVELRKKISQYLVLI